MVDLNEPGLEIVVNHDIEAQYLKTQLVLNVFWLTRPKNVGHGWLPRDHGLDDQILNSSLERCDIMPLPPDDLPD